MAKPTALRCWPEKDGIFGKFAENSGSGCCFCEEKRLAGRPETGVFSKMMG